MRALRARDDGALIEGAADGGADVLDLGLVGTEMVYYAVGELELDGGVCVTASHNPKEYTGMKIVRRGALPVGGDSGLDDVRRACGAAFGAVARRGDVTAERCVGRVRREGALVRRRGGRQAPQGRRRRRERHGRDDAPAGARAPSPARRRAVLLRARRGVPEPRAEPAAAREPRVHRREDALGGGRPRRRVRRRRRPLLLRRRHRRVRPRRLRHGAPRAGDARQGARAPR